jgi:hypothetical protein
MAAPIRNRIKSHRRVRAGDLVPHELNFRTHGDVQRDALQALYRDIGFARSLLAYELPDGRLKLIDGHLRRDLDPEIEVEVEVLDVNEEEARKSPRDPARPRPGVAQRPAHRVGGPRTQCPASRYAANRIKWS